MNIKELTYPVFEVNQVLSNAHLNDLFEYLDEQTRLTRSNLVGIGIVCGLESTFEAPGTVRLSRGCGVTSEGYLIVEPEDLTLGYVRTYKLPTQYGYPPFCEDPADQTTQYDLWELFPDDDEPGAQPLATSGLVLEDKAVVLFLELNKDRQRSCSPVSCDDRGGQVTTTVRRLLVDVVDLDKVIAATSDLAPTYLGADLTERLALPDLRMPRVDVPNTGRVSPEAVLHAFQDVFRQNKLAARTAGALSALYAAFRPVVADRHGSDPFARFLNRFGFLDAVPATKEQVRFLQYYWDFFDDLIAAYDDVRWQGLDLMCACCPPEGLFPRHLMVGVLDPSRYDTADYRHRFVRSPAIGGCEDRTRDVKSLFSRLVALVEGFTESPPDRGVKVTPSRAGEAPLSARAIPYYYDDEERPLRDVWDPVKAGHGRANQNLGYRSDTYLPPAPAFVTDPLRFDLGANDFLRIEGHLGKNVQSVLESLLAVRKSHRLPIEVIALRSGTFDENVEIDLSKETCRFRDLETLYDTLKSELSCFLVKQVQYFYSLHLDDDHDELVNVAPTLGLLKRYSPTFAVQPGTLGQRIEGVLNWKPGIAPPRLIFTVAGTPDLQSLALSLVGAMSDLDGRLTDDLRQVDFTGMGDRYRAIVAVARQMADLRQSGAFDEPGLADRLDDIVFRCRLDPFEAIAEEYKRRIREAKEASYLGHFMENHPGIQHKAGVPLGGTFILIYHELPTTVAAPTGPRPSTDLIANLGTAARIGLQNKFQLDETKANLLSTALARIQYKGQLAEDPDLRQLFQIVTGNVLVPRLPVTRLAEQVYADTVAGLPDGAVIADFFLPYNCCSDCPPIQYQLPPARLRVTADKSCTNADGFAEVTVRGEGTSGALSVQVDDGPFEELTGALSLSAGNHTLVVRDAAGTESSPLEVVIPPQLVIAGSEVVVDAAAGTFSVVATLQGGTPPYATDAGTVVDATFTSLVTAVTDLAKVAVTDAAGCSVEAAFESGVAPCDLPCDGVAIREGFRFWLPEARPNLPINDYQVDPGSFEIIDQDGKVFSLAPDLHKVLARFPNPIRSSDFESVVQRWMEGLNKITADRLGSDQYFRLEYEAASDGAPNGTMFVERLACFDFRFSLFARWVQGGRELMYTLGFDSSGSSISESATRTRFRIPPFRATSSNKCRPGEPPVEVCGGTDLTLEMLRDGVAPDEVVLAASAGGSDVPVAFLWEVQDGVPTVAGGEKVVFTFDPVEPVDKLVRLTAFTEKGCSVTVEQTINIVENR